MIHRVGFWSGLIVSFGATHRGALDRERGRAVRELRIGCERALSSSRGTVRGDISDNAD